MSSDQPLQPSESVSSCSLCNPSEPGSSSGQPLVMVWLVRLEGSDRQAAPPLTAETAVPAELALNSPRPGSLTSGSFTSGTCNARTALATSATTGAGGIGQRGRLKFQLASNVTTGQAPCAGPIRPHLDGGQLGSLDGGRLLGQLRHLEKECSKHAATAHIRQAARVSVVRQIAGREPPSPLRWPSNQRRFLLLASRTEGHAVREHSHPHT